MTGKPREIDLVAEKFFPIIGGPFGRVVGAVAIQMFVECKYIDRPTVFWTHEQDESATFRLLKARTPLRSTNSFSKDHHYLASTGGRVAKLFAANPKGQSQNEPVFLALSQSLNATIALRHKLQVLDTQTPIPVKYLIAYPVIVFNSFDNVYSVRMEDESDLKSVGENFLLEVNYAYIDSRAKERSEYFLIDMAALDRFGSLLESIETDVRIIGMLASD